MEATRALLQIPPSKLTIFSTYLSQVTPFLNLQGSNSVSFDGFDSKTAVMPNMRTARLVKMNAFRKGLKGQGDNESSPLMFRQEVFAEKSSEFRSVFMAMQVGAIINSLSKWAIAVIFVSVLLWRNDAKSLWAATGAVTNLFFNAALKRVFNQERPISTLKSDPGMPSSHAQSIFYILFLSILSITERLGVNEFTMIITAMALASGAYLSWLRVSQKYHTTSQVVVGAIVGSSFCILWFWSWNAIMLQAFISLWWVRAIVILGAATCSLCFIFSVIAHLLTDNK